MNNLQQSNSGKKPELDAAVVWLRALVHSVVRDGSEAEALFREIPALHGLILYKNAVERARPLVH